MFSKMKGLDVAFRYVRGFSIVVLVCCMVLVGLLLFQRHQEVMAGQNRIYVLADGKVLQAMGAERKDNLPVEARDHIRSLHTNFFTIDPDEKAIQEHISNALYLGDESVKKLYDNLRESGYYSDIISANINQRISVDSILVNTDQAPYYFRFYGKEHVIRTTRTVIRNLTTEGYLREISRSDHNPHGFLVSRWTILNNDEIPNK